MISGTCEECGKTFEAYTEGHLQNLIYQHNLKHVKEKRKREGLGRERDE